MFRTWLSAKVTDITYTFCSVRFFANSNCRAGRLTSLSDKKYRYVQFGETGNFSDNKSLIFSWMRLQGGSRYPSYPWVCRITVSLTKQLLKVIITGGVLLITDAFVHVFAGFWASFRPCRKFLSYVVRNIGRCSSSWAVIALIKWIK